MLLKRDGSVIPDQARKLRRWEEHFKELLNHAAPPNTAFSPPDTPAAETYPCEVDPPTLDEVCTAIRQLRNNRAPGEDGIPAEVYKTCLDSLGPWLHRVITKAWLCEAVPYNLSEAVLLPLFKKGDKRICSNYRGISLINVAAKVLVSSSSKASSTRETSALALIKVALFLDVDARIRCTTYVAHWSSVGASSKLLLCASLILLLRLIP